MNVDQIVYLIIPHRSPGLRVGSPWLDIDTYGHAAKDEGWWNCCWPRHFFYVVTSSICVFACIYKGVCVWCLTPSKIWRVLIIVYIDFNWIAITEPPSGFAGKDVGFAE